MVMVPRNFCKNGHDMSITRVTCNNGNTYCGVCCKEWKRKYRQNHPEKSKAWKRKQKLKLRYGMTPQDAENLLKSQGGVCSICGGNNWGFYGYHIDHDHETGIVRGILCGSCNRGLGCFYDDISKLQLAIEYLAKHKMGSV